MIRTVTILTALALVALAAPAQAKTPRPIVYTVVIDGLDGDRVDAGRAPFISSLLAGQDARATYYRESRSIMVAETNPNHTAMITGAYGNRSGIPGNSFALYSKLANENTCRRTGKVDLTRAPSITSGANAGCIEAETVFGAIRRQGNPDGLVTAGVFGKPKLGRLFAGGSRGREHDADHLWAPCADDKGKDDDDYCAKVPLDEDNGYAKDDATPMNAVLDTMRRGVGKARRRPDFTFVNLQQVDATGHKKGTDTGDYDRAIAAADVQVKRLVDELKARGEWSRTTLILLSDHSMDTTPRLTNLTRRLSAARGVRSKDFVTVLNGSADMVYLANRKSPRRHRLLKRMRAAALRTPGVVEALYRKPNPADGGRRHTLRAAHPGWHLDGERTGDLFVTHRSGGAFAEPDNDLVGNHGGPQTRDNFFAVVGGGAQVRQSLPAGRRGPLFDDTLVNRAQAENVDPAPTVMGMFGLAPPGDSRGRFLSEALDTAALPGAATPARRATIKVTGPRSPLRGVSCREARRRRVPVRIRLGPDGWRYDLGVTEGGSGRRLLVVRNTAKRVLRTSLRPGTTARFVASLRAASGKTGTDRSVSIRAAAPRC